MSDRREKSEKVPCPFCGSGLSRVLPWFRRPAGHFRRRQCDSCLAVFETQEQVTRAVKHPVVKSQGGRL